LKPSATSSAVPGNSPQPTSRISAANIVLSLVVLALLAGLIQKFIGWSQLVRPWLELSIYQIIVAVSLVMASYVLRALRLYDYFRGQIAATFWPCLALILQHNMLNNLLPMRMGEISFPVLMARYYSLPPLRSIPVLFWFRLLDLHVLLAIALVAGGMYWLDLFTTMIALSLWMAVPYLCYRLRFTILGRLTEFRSSSAGQGRFLALVREAFTSLPADDRTFWRSLLWTMINWLAKAAVFTWLLLQFVDAPLSSAWMGVIGGDVTSVLPIHGVAGIGTYEGGVVAAMSLFRVPAIAALPGAINLHLFILGVSVVGGAIGLLIRKSKKHGPATIAMD